MIGVEVDEASFGECFENLTLAQEVLQELSLTLQRVRDFEPDFLASTVYHLSQFLHFSLARPSLENGEALQRYLKSLQHSLEFRAKWPQIPLFDLRSGTCLDGEDQIIFEHPSEGLIRLLWMNPLPTPAWLQRGGYQCDVCFNPDIRSGYQHVTEDNARDMSRLLDQRTGFDLCVPCAVQHILANRTKIESWIYTGGSTDSFTYRRFAEDNAEIRLVLRRCHDSVHIEVAGSGGFHCAVAVMQKDDKLPVAWMSMGRKLTTSPRRAAPGSLLKVRFGCAKNGDTILLSGYPALRGRLCFESSSLSKNCGEVHAIQVAACNNEEGLWRLSFHPLGECAWLADPQSLEEVRVLASQAGCAHNITRKPSEMLDPELPELMRASSSSDAGPGANLSFATHPGTAGAFFEPLSTDVCAICLGSLGEQTWIRGEPWQTRCRHYFHRLCLRRHLRISVESMEDQKLDSGACPNCRLPSAALGTTNCPAKPLSWQLMEDIRSEPLQMEKEYRFLAVLCQDPEAVVHSSVFLVQKTIKFKDLPD